MNSKRFAITLLLLVGVLCLGVVGGNVWMNDFGLYGDVQGKEIRIWGYERASKYLLSMKYVPTNFDGVLLGPSVTDVMLDTRRLENGKIYNLSLNGGNICELKKLYDNVAQHTKLKTLIVSVSPFITRDCMMKTAEINPKLKESVLGSLFSLRFYVAKAKALLNPEHDVFRDSWWGYRLNQPAPEGYDAPSLIRKNAEQGFSLDMTIDPNALVVLEELMLTAKGQGTRVCVLYPPIPWPLYTHIEKDYMQYMGEVGKVIDAADVIIDFNSPEFRYLNGDLSNFYDVSHLNQKGAGLVLRALDASLESL